MIVKVHKIHWDGRYTKSGETIDFEVTDTDCMVTKVTHPCANWAIGEYWHRVCTWFEGKGAKVTLGKADGEKDDVVKSVCDCEVPMRDLSGKYCYKCQAPCRGRDE